MRLILRPILALLLALLAATPALASWHRADSHHFIIYSDGDARTLEQFTRRLELFDALFRQYFGLAPDDDPTRLTIYLLASSDDVSALSGDQHIAGFYSARREGSFAVSNRERGGRRTSLTGETVLYHEYVHHLMFHHFTFGYPAWYREGFAEYFATADIRANGDWTLGEPADHRAIGLRNTSIPLERVLFGDTDGMNAAAGDAYYGRSWLMVHMFANDPELTAALNAFLAEVGRGADQREAFARHFGAVEAMDRRLDSYLRGRMNSLRSVQPITMRGTVSVTTLDDAEGERVALEMRRRVGREPAATRDALRALAERHPENVAIRAELALAEWDAAEEAETPDLAAAAAATERALELAPDNPRMIVLQTDIMRRQDAPDMRAIRSLLARAARLAPTDPLPAIAHYESYARSGGSPPVEVVNGLMLAFRRVPEASDVRITLAYALVNEGLVGDAIRLIEFLAGDPHSGERGRRVLADLRAIQQRQAQAPAD